MKATRTSTCGKRWRQIKGCEVASPWRRWLKGRWALTTGMPRFHAPPVTGNAGGPLCLLPTHDHLFYKTLWTNTRFACCTVQDEIQGWSIKAFSALQLHLLDESWVLEALKQYSQRNTNKKMKLCESLCVRLVVWVYGYLLWRTSLLRYHTLPAALIDV